MPKIRKNPEMKSRKTSEPKAPEVPEVPEVSQTPEVPEVSQAPEVPEVPEVPEGPLGDFRTELEVLIQDISSQFDKFEEIYKGLATKIHRLDKKIEKEMEKKRKRKEKRTLTGFAKPSEVSPELMKFLGLAKGELISRPQVTKKLNAYIKEHNLQNKEDKRIYTPDKKLKKLLGEPVYYLNKSSPEKGKGYSYFNIQSYVNKHFIKPQPAQETDGDKES